MPAETTFAAPETSSRRRWVAWVAALALVALFALILLQPDLRGLAGDTWREMRSIPPLSLALILLFKAGQSTFSALTWRNALVAAWPNSNLSYRFVLGVEQGQVVMNTVMPARAGTWAMLGIFGLSIRGARAPKMLAVWGVQALAFSLFALINYSLLAFGLPEQTQSGGGGLTDRVTSFAKDQPLLAGGATVLGVGLAVLVTRFARRRVLRVRQQVREGLAILHPPVRYVRALVLPSLVSYLFSCASYVVLLSAFGIPVTIWTVSLALGSNALAGTVRITPGGLGTTQALDAIALRDYAAPEVVTAFSLSELAVSALVSLTLAVVSLLSVSGWRGTRSLLLHLHRGDVVHRLQALAERQRVLRAGMVQRRRALRAAAVQRRQVLRARLGRHPAPGDD